LHFIITSPGKTLTTALFIADDPYLDSDAVFLAISFCAFQVGRHKLAQMTVPSSAEEEFASASK
jgi:hypothetical protein